MSELRTLFRYCPQCGRRFEIRLVRKELVDDRLIQKGQMPVVGPRSTNLETIAPVTVELKEFDYTYRCNHCGHMWSEVHDADGAKWQKDQ